MKEYKLVMKLLAFLSKLLDYIYYRKCYICSKKCTEISLCQECYEKIFDSLKFEKAEKFGTTIYSGAIYEGNLLKIIRALKYHKKQEFKKILADIIIKTIKNYNIDLDGFVICPVPIHQSRFKKRKYNHMELVAQEVAQYFNLEIRTNLLLRIKNTEPLYKLSVLERKKAIDGAFLANEEIKDKKILLVDDIVTSGTTISELTKIIYEKQPQKLVVICASKSNNCNF